MQPRSRKKLSLTRETLRSLTLSRTELGQVVGGISGPRGCHSIQDRCPDPTTATLCGASQHDYCPSGVGGGCGSSNSVCD